MTEPIFSEDLDRIGWSDLEQFSRDFGVKGATSLAIPRLWIPPFVLLPTTLIEALDGNMSLSSILRSQLMDRLLALGGEAHQLIVRSSVVGESIWDRGTYESFQVDLSGDTNVALERLGVAARRVKKSVGGRAAGLMIQSYVRPVAQGEFGNLQRISKTRDQWEVSTREPDGFTSRQRLNSQRDQAADPNEPLSARAGLARERLFGAVGAWLNNELLLGRSQRLNCEWITDNRQYYVVQVDEEDEDHRGINPFQIRVSPAIKPSASSGDYLKLAKGPALKEWDKLLVLEQLWEPDASHKPTLFYVPFSDLPDRADEAAVEKLVADFRKLIGPAGIVVRTSGPAGAEKLPNLPRTECMTPDTAAAWCMDKADRVQREHNTDQFAFVVHRFVAARAAAWARAEPGNPMVEINSLWGLPDALQYCPYDIWEVHVPTGVATDYNDYKSDMLIPREDGSWEYARVKNELARTNSIGSVEAKEIATRSLAIAERLGRPCHIMWFVGCADEASSHFNIPWYWTEAHDAERNPDRSSYRVFTVSDEASLKQFVEWKGVRNRQALALRPTDLALMRDSKFIEAVGLAARSAQVPIVLSGSTLAHAYYQLRKLGCSVVTPSEKDHARTRRTASLGKLVRDKIPEKIAKRHELGVTRQISGNLLKRFLISKLLEEALEVREAAEPAQKAEELADLFEVMRAIAKAEGVSLDTIEQAADQKKRKAGGFEDGLVLLQTAIAPPDKASASDSGIMEVIAQQTSEDTAEIPFSFFGFMDLDRPRSIYFERLGIWLNIVLRPDRLEIRITRAPEQLELRLDNS